MNLLFQFSRRTILFMCLVMVVALACKKENSASHPPLGETVALPATNITPTAFTANWEVNPGATHYKLYVATDSNFINLLNGYNPLTVEGNSTNLTGLISSNNYYYRLIGVSNLDSQSLPSNFIFVHTPSPTDDRYVYIGSGDMNFYCFYAGTGAKVWSFPTLGDIESSAAIHDSVLYFGSTDQRLYALNAYTGQKLWNFLTLGPILSSPTTSSTGVYIAANSGYVFGVNLNGSKKWSNQPAGESVMFSSPAVVDGTVFIGSQNSNLYAYDAITGAQKWSAATDDTINSSPAVSNGVVYVGSSDKHLYAFDEATGTLKWKFAANDSLPSSPTVSNGVVYIGCFDGKLYAVDATTGTMKWSMPTGGRIQSSPAVVDGVVYVGSFDNKLYAANAETGAIKWSVATNGRVMSSPTVSNGVVYVGSYDNNLYAFDAATGSIKWKAVTGGPIRMASPTVLTYPGVVVLPKVSGDVQ